MTDAIMQQVFEQVKKAVEAASSARPLLCFKYVPNVGYEPSHRCDPAASPCRSERMQEALHVDGDRRSREENRDHSIGANAHPHYRLVHERPTKSTTASTPKNKYRGLEEGSSNDDGLPSVVLTGLRFLRKERKHAWPEPRDEECSTEMVVTIVGRYAEGITRSAWKAQLRGAQQVLTAEQGSRITVPTMVFGGGQDPHFTSPHNDPLVVERKVASAIVRRILIDTGSSVDIIAWDCLKKLTYPGRDIVHLIRGEPYRSDSPSLTLWRQGKGKEFGGGRLSCGCSHGLQYHPRTSRSSSRSLPSAVPVTSPLWSAVEASASRGMVSSLSRPPGVKLHQLGVLTLSSGPTMILDKLDVRIEIAFNTEGLRRRGHQELPKKLSALTTSPMIATILCPSQLFSLGFCLGASLLQLVL
ncbi:hypothetical protein Cgig2_004659 [Carnegiea gigantea]|uniref:Uncharacterized protein n=1 Tax=Carnegiea gigantea TaxID=171969 RepID=A0A9Q1Q9R2_9CARY|nr:hypothetical protein Cgig2_004659 [Carnegiea gigantea]